MAKKREFTVTRGWHKVSPKTMKQRRQLFDRCGRKAFLDPKNLSFPIIAKSGPCVVDCQGLLAAKSRAAQMVTRSKNAGRKKDAAKYARIAKKAEQKGVRNSCAWAGH